MWPASLKLLDALLCLVPDYVRDPEEWGDKSLGNVPFFIANIKWLTTLVVLNTGVPVLQNHEIVRIKMARST